MRALFIGLTGLLATTGLAREGFYDHCNQVLVNGVLESYESDHEFEKKIALKKWLCSHKSGSTNAGGDLELNVIEIFTLGGGGGSARQWKEEHCRDTDYHYEGSAASHILIQKANEPVIEAWKACVLKNKPTNDKLVCLGRETGDSLLMELDFGYGIGDITNLEVVGTGLTALTREPTLLRPGKTAIRYRKQNPQQEAYFDLNGEADYLNVSCSYTIPPRPVLEDRNECENFRIESLYAGLIDERDYIFLQTHDQVPLFRNRHMTGYYPCSMYTNN